MLVYLEKFSKKFLGIAILLCSCFIFIALLTYNQSDPSFLNATHKDPSNLSGHYGSFIIDPCIQSLGYAVVLPIFFALVLSIKLLTNKQQQLLFFKLTFLIAALPFVAALLSSVSIPGGFIGWYIFSEMNIRLEKIYFSQGILASISLAVLLFSMNLTLKEWYAVLSLFIRSINKSFYIFINIIKYLYLKISYLSKKLQGEEVEERSINIIPSRKEVKPAMISKKVDLLKSPIQSSLKFDSNDFTLPYVSFLNDTLPKKFGINENALSQNAKILLQVLSDFGIKGDIIKINPGPVVTLYELEPAAGTKSSRVIGLSDDIARSMSSVSARISVVQGKNAMGVELPNSHRETVYLRELLETTIYQQTDHQLPLILGKNIGGEVIIADLAKMPHLLVAGTTGSGKSVAINTMILSLLYKYSPRECRFVMIDPKMLELSVYADIPHLLSPVVTQPKKAVIALKWVVREMENRYRAMSILGIRNIQSYNKLFAEAQSRGEKLSKQIQTGFDHQTGKPIFETINTGDEPLPYIVVIVDEMADLMLVAGKDIECYIQRLAQMARAAGIHLIMATQRPSVDVITGVIKANFPTRISFQVTSKIDSRTILGEQGAEQLLGMGDMLYMSGGGRIERIHGPFVDDNEVEKVASFLRSQGAPEYINDITEEKEESDAPINSSEEPENDLYMQALEIVIKERKATTSYLQRCFKIGYNKAASLIDRMEKEGVISQANHVGKREVLVDENYKY